MTSARKPAAPEALPRPLAPQTKDPSTVDLPAQLKCAQRELKIRRDVYPAWVRAGRMNVFTAEDEMAAMAAIVKTLQGLVDGGKSR